MLDKDNLGAPGPGKYYSYNPEYIHLVRLGQNDKLFGGSLERKLFEPKDGPDPGHYQKCEWDGSRTARMGYAENQSPRFIPKKEKEEPGPRKYRTFTQFIKPIDKEVFRNRLRKMKARDKMRRRQEQIRLDRK